MVLLAFAILIMLLGLRLLDSPMKRSERFKGDPTAPYTTGYVPKAPSFKVTKPKSKGFRRFH